MANELGDPANAVNSKEHSENLPSKHLLSPIHHNQEMSKEVHAQSCHECEEARELIAGHVD